MIKKIHHKNLDFLKKERINYELFKKFNIMKNENS